eukprot:m.238212 g.238212  ORF g.238212 m.238212 type:complete len:152 (+) comp26564_c0_seq22:177-632(+)
MAAFCFACPPPSMALTPSAGSLSSPFLSNRQNGAIYHTRVLNDGAHYRLGKTQSSYPTIWDLVESYMDQSLNPEYDGFLLKFPLPVPEQLISPTICRFVETPLDEPFFDADILRFMTGELDAAGIRRARDLRERQQNDRKTAWRKAKKRID